MSTNSIHSIKSAWHTASFIYPENLVKDLTVEQLDKAFVEISNNTSIDKLEINKNRDKNDQLKFTAPYRNIQEQIKVDLSSPLNRYFGRLNFRTQRFIYQMKQWLGRVVGHEANGAVKDKLQAIQTNVTALIPGKRQPLESNEGATTESSPPTRKFEPKKVVQNFRSNLPSWFPGSTKPKPETSVNQTEASTSSAEATGDSTTADE